MNNIWTVKDVYIKFLYLIKLKGKNLFDRMFKRSNFLDQRKIDIVCNQLPPFFPVH